MAAHILVLETPFFSVAEIDAETQRATYEIRDVPAGNYVLKAWHKKLKMKSGAVGVTVVAGETATVDFAIMRRKKN